MQAHTKIICFNCVAAIAFEHYQMWWFRLELYCRPSKGAQNLLNHILYCRPRTCTSYGNTIWTPEQKRGIGAILPIIFGLINECSYNGILCAIQDTKVVQRITRSSSDHYHAEHRPIIWRQSSHHRRKGGTKVRHHGYFEYRYVECRQCFWVIYHGCFKWENII